MKEFLIINTELTKLYIIFIMKDVLRIRLEVRIYFDQFFKNYMNYSLKIFQNHHINLIMNQPQQKQTDRGNTLHQQQYLKIGQFLSSKKGHRAILQADGNFVLFRNTKAIWDTSTNGKRGVKLLMEDNGNLVLYDIRDAVLWQTNTTGIGQPPYKLVMQQDQNLVLYSKGQKAIWQSQTWSPN